MSPNYWARVVIVVILAGSAVTDLQTPVGHEPSASRMRIISRRCWSVEKHRVKFLTPEEIWSSRNKPTGATTERIEQGMLVQGETILPVTPGVLAPFVTSIHHLPEDPRPLKDLQRAPQNKFPTWSERVGLGRISFPGRK